METKQRPFIKKFMSCILGINATYKKWITGTWFSDGHGSATFMDSVMLKVFSSWNEFIILYILHLYLFFLFLNILIELIEFQISYKGVFFFLMCKILFQPYKLSWKPNVYTKFTPLALPWCCLKWHSLKFQYRINRLQESKYIFTVCCSS